MTNTKNRKLIFWLSLLMVLFTVIFTATMTVSADDGWIDWNDPEDGTPVGIQIKTDGVDGTDYEIAYDGHNVLKILTGKPISLKGEYEYAMVEIAAGVDADITLCGVTIKRLTIADDSTGNVTLRLADDTVNTITNGLVKNGDGQDVGTLTICGNGSLTASGYHRAAGIGGSEYGNTANIVIESGNITAVGGYGGAGIGSGYKGNARNIVIKGGVVTAYVADGYGAGIGGGHSVYGQGGIASDIIIMGGSVKATGGKDNDGDGGPDMGNGGANSSGEALDGEEVQPTEGEEPVYLCEIENSTEADIVIDGVDYPDKHGTEKKIYAYLTADLHTVEIGDTKKIYDYIDGQWTEYTPITTAAELQAINDDLSGNYVLMNDIDLDGVTWTPIGTIYDVFTGKFSGNGHVIENITISSGDYVGLFVDNRGLIMNVGIESGSISGKYAGGICVENGGTIFGCYNNADITGSGQYAGGICQYNYGTIDNCLNSGSVNNAAVAGLNTNYAGGIAGYSDSSSTISNCINVGSVNAEDEANAIVGYDNTNGSGITNCYYLDSTAEYASYFNFIGKDRYSADGKLTLAELLVLDIDGEDGTVWSAGSASFTAEDVTVDENDERMGTADAKLPYLTVFGENAAPTAEVDVYNFSLTDTPDWQTYTPITTQAELFAVKNASDGNYVLMNDIELDGEEHLYINAVLGFTGKFSGNGHVISNVNSTAYGLFNTNSGLIMDLGVEGTVMGPNYVGGIVGTNSGTVSGCYFKGDVSAQSHPGGIAGRNEQGGIVDNCFAIGSVTSSGNYAGGIVGDNCGTLSNSYCISEVALTGTYTVKGGVCGTNGGTITNCYYNKDIYTDEDSTRGVVGLSTLDMTAGNALATMGLDADIWAKSDNDKENGVAYYPYLKAFGEDSAASVSYETKLSIEYDESKDAPVYGEDLYFIVSALVKFDGMEEFVPVEGGSFRFAYAGAEISDYYTIADRGEITVKLAFPDRLCAGDHVIYLEYDGSDNEFISSCTEELEISIAKAVIDSVTIDIDIPQPEVALDMEPVVTPEGMYYELTWHDAGGCDVNNTIAEYGGIYAAHFRMWSDDDHEFADTVTVTAPTEDFEVDLNGNLFVYINFPELPEEVKPDVWVRVGDSEALIEWDALEGATSYRVYSYNGTSYKLLATTTETSYTAAGLDNGTEYGFLVRALIDGEWTNFDTERDVVYVTPVEGMKPVVTAYPENYQVYLEWEHIIGAESYRVYSYLNGRYTLEDEVTDTWYTVDGLKADVEYGFLVRAYVDGKWTSFTTEDNVYATPTAAECPELDLYEYVNSVEIGWAEVSGATNYRVYSYLNGKFTLLGETTDTYYYADGLVAGVEYGFLVRAYAGGKWTAFDVDTDVYYATPMSADCPGLQLVGRVHGMDITWDAVENAENYRVYSYLNGKYTLRGETTETEYSVTGLAGGEMYGFLVRALVAGRWTEFDTDRDVYYASALAEFCPVLELTADADSVYIEWDAVEDAESYRVYSYLDGKYTLLEETESLSYTATELELNTEYGFLVRAYVNGTWTAFTTEDNENIYVDDSAYIPV